MITLLRYTLLTLLFSNSIYAINPEPGYGTTPITTSEKTKSESSNITTIDNMFISLRSLSKNKLDASDLNKYKTKDNCPIDSDTEGDTFGVGYCKDGTFSFKQPASQGYFNQEGMCGQTAVSNMFRMYCGWNITPESADSYVRDYTPGVAASTLASGLNKLFSRYGDCPYGSWKKVVSKSQKEFISEISTALTPHFPPNQVKRRRSNGKIEKRAPVATLIRIPGKQILHWITIVDLEFTGGECNMVFNTWDDQYRAPCYKIGQWSRGVNKSYPLLDAYTTVSFQ